ncbi:inactive peptidyl-prolyl cis-trans isomerase FKBP6-like [Pollicipes pollicipes]|uniref:inactive peptidyl-prolyl cis-trans isomerase FKBP6-like n=1 Tax=Pollicipes pollicipes TaxID=41117 RepID=UPI0018849B23|nr:inactive peptidyl-prolyl cis-trans isomerase FKBP6-like [Pollicipes pollicipes]
MSHSGPPEEFGLDGMERDEIVGHVPQKVDRSKLMSDGWEFEATTPAAGDEFEADKPERKKEYFEGLAKLNEDGHSLAEYCQGLGLDDENEADPRQPFAALRERMTDLLGDGGVMKLVRTAGSGAQLPPGCRATVHYVGQFEGFDEPFDSTYVRNRGRPETYLVGPNSQLLPGLNQVLLSMKKGETALALVSPDYAFGKMGCGPRIPGDMEALFEVTVVSFTDSTDADEFDDLTEEEQKRSSFQMRIKAIRCHHVKGNELYSRREYHKAARSYKDATRVFLSNMSFKNEEEHQEAKHIIFKVMSNRTQALLQLARWKEAALQGRQALHYEDCADPDMRQKLYTRLAKAMIYVPEYEEASRLLKRAERLRPRSRDVIALSELLAARQKTDKLQEVEFAKRAFQSHKQVDTAEAALNADSESKTEQPEPEPKPEPTTIRVSDEFKHDIERTLRQFLADPCRRELALPLHQSEDGHHKLAHICVRCRQLGLRFVADSGCGRPRVVKD